MNGRPSRFRRRGAWRSARFALHKLIASAVVLLTPTGLVAVGAAARRPGAAVRRQDAPVDRQRAWRFIQFAVRVPLAVFTAFSLCHEVKLDWTGAPWIGAVPAVAFGIVHVGRDPRERHAGMDSRRLGAHACRRCWCFYGAGLYHLAIGIPGLGYGRHAELVPVGWRELGRQIHGLARCVAETERSDPLIVGMDRYAIASELAFYAPDQAAAVRDVFERAPVRSDRPDVRALVSARGRARPHTLAGGAARGGSRGARGGARRCAPGARPVRGDPA